MHQEYLYKQRQIDGIRHWVLAGMLVIGQIAFFLALMLVIAKNSHQTPVVVIMSIIALFVLIVIIWLGKLTLRHLLGRIQFFFDKNSITIQQSLFGRIYKEQTYEINNYTEVGLECQRDPRDASVMCRGGNPRASLPMYPFVFCLHMKRKETGHGIGILRFVNKGEALEVYEAIIRHYPFLKQTLNLSQESILFNERQQLKKLLVSFMFHTVLGFFVFCVFSYFLLQSIFNFYKFYNEITRLSLSTEHYCPLKMDKVKN